MSTNTLQSYTIALKEGGNPKIQAKDRGDLLRKISTIDPDLIDKVTEDGGQEFSRKEISHLYEEGVALAELKATCDQIEKNDASTILKFVKNGSQLSMAINVAMGKGVMGKTETIKRLFLRRLEELGFDPLPSL